MFNESYSLSQSRRLIIPPIQIQIHTNPRVSRALSLFLQAAIRTIITFQPKKVGCPFFSFLAQLTLGCIKPFTPILHYDVFCFHGAFKRLGDIFNDLGVSLFVSECKNGVDIWCGAKLPSQDFLSRSGLKSGLKFWPRHVLELGLELGLDRGL